MKAQYHLVYDISLSCISGRSWNSIYEQVVIVYSQLLSD